MGQYEVLEPILLSSDARRDVKRRIRELRDDRRSFNEAFGAMPESERLAGLAETERCLNDAEELYADEAIWLGHFQAPQAIAVGVFEAQEFSYPVKHWLFKNRAFETRGGPLFEYDVNQGKIRDPLKTPGEDSAVAVELPRRPPSKVRREVWRRDEGKCVRCGSRQRLEYDHIIPVVRGGSNTARNIELLCELCNRRKGSEII